MKLPIVVNLFGGPGTGKSRIALELAGRLKGKGMDVEYVDEWIKKAAWLGYHDLFNQPDMIAANQRRKLETVKDHCSIVITDSPLVITVPYAQHYVTDWPQKPFQEMILSLFSTYNNYNVWVDRDPRIFKQTGRRETLDQATTLDAVIRKFINEHVIVDLFCTNTAGVVEEIEDNLISHATGIFKYANHHHAAN